MTKQYPIESLPVTRLTPNGTIRNNDLITVEEPLEIQLIFNDGLQLSRKKIAVTMRTPGNDFELALGFLFTEGIIEDVTQVKAIQYCQQVEPEYLGNVITVIVKEEVTVNIDTLTRNFFTSSSCGVCGKASIESVNTVSGSPFFQKVDTVLSQSQLFHLTEKLRKEQTIFKYTGSIHAAGLFDFEGNLLLINEDVGRHNAVDKLIGSALQQKLLPAKERIIVVSGRAGFELVQKSVMAGIPVMGAVGAPSNLAIKLAKKVNMALIGFIKKESYNMYVTQTEKAIARPSKTYHYEMSYNDSSSLEKDAQWQITSDQ
ncbi:formate dehydrogenase accessory sulfurtransferase FdhD [Aquimarina sp. U1-2]|uniref:formate dehydrogenase accessory sulfurtransferase FdhD n=1 Tax=Aquimarina sp. U1-2 TaxID=2823141 RepID=UPI001AECACF1|nr:formate dehydrogenase accessory sulfurtransferase FdhD [Aquimarina sp. U1-2]MBP2831015.1 formate dehydrogenase accessory sulfurtransferase FdhD [Aquimarina sp. U1-2]